MKGIDKQRGEQRGGPRVERAVQTPHPHSNGCRPICSVPYVAKKVLGQGNGSSLKPCKVCCLCFAIHRGKIAQG